MTEDEWAQLIVGATPSLHSTIKAHTFRRKWDSASHPRQLICEDGHDYVVKGNHLKRTVVNDHLVGRLGKSLEAPVPELALIEITEEFVLIEPRLAPILPGIHHGSRYISGTIDDREGFGPVELDANRDRFASLAVLYGWIGARDHQVIYLKASPRLVYSVDHGHFFPNGPEWTVDGLNGAPAAIPDQHVIGSCHLSAMDVGTACSALMMIPPERIAECIAAIPEDWWKDPFEPGVVAAYLERRRHEMLGYFGLK